MTTRTNKTGKIIPLAISLALALLAPRPLRAQGDVPHYEVDPSWPKPLPDHWITGMIGGVCVDAQDHVFVLNRHNLTDHELDAGTQAPAVIEFDPEGNVVNSWGDPNVLPLGSSLHSCMVDRDNNLWLTSVSDGIVQKYSHDGKLLLQIGKRGVVDSSDGTLTGKALNSGHAAFFRPSGIAFDKSGNLYVSDGEILGGNHRVAVFDPSGQFLRQWEPHRAPEETGDDWRVLVVCVSVDVDGNVYTCDRAAHRLQVFDTMGNFKKNIPIPFEPRSQYSTAGPGHSPSAWGLVVPGGWGTAVAVNFSRDPQQKFMFVTNEDDEQIEILDRASDRILAHFGRGGHQLGEFTHSHHLAVDSKGNIYVGEVSVGERVQKFRIVGSP